MLINSTLVMEMMNNGRHLPHPTSQSRNTDFDGLGCQPFSMDVTPAAHPTLLHCNQNKKKNLGCDEKENQIHCNKKKYDMITTSWLPSPEQSEEERWKPNYRQLFRTDLCTPLFLYRGWRI